LTDATIQVAKGAMFGSYIGDEILMEGENPFKIADLEIVVVPP